MYKRVFIGLHVQCYMYENEQAKDTFLLSCITDNKLFFLFFSYILAARKNHNVMICMMCALK